jgi:hypothetical protein
MPSLAVHLAALASRIAAEFNAVRGELAGAGGGGSVQLTRAAFDLLAGKAGLVAGTSYVITDQDALFVALSSTAYLVATTAKIYAPINLLENGLLEEGGPPPVITEGGGTATLVFDQAAQKLRFTGGTGGTGCKASWTIAGLEPGFYTLKYELSEQGGACRPKFSLGGMLFDQLGQTNGERSATLETLAASEDFEVTFTPDSPAVRKAAIGKLRLYRKTVELTLDSNIVSEDVPVGTIVGTLQGRIPGSTLTLTDSAEGRFVLDGLNIVTALPLDYEQWPGHVLQVTELAPGAEGSPRTSDVSVGVTNVANLQVLWVDDPNIWPGTLSLEWAGQLMNMTPGSVLTLMDDAGGRFILDGSILRNVVDMDDENGTQFYPVIRETVLVGVEDSPKDTPVTIIVTNQAT